MTGSEQERKAQVIQRAWWLAMSGEFGSWREVESRMLTLGFVDAPRWLADPVLREKMDTVCRRIDDGPGTQLKP